MTTAILWVLSQQSPNEVLGLSEGGFVAICVALIGGPLVAILMTRGTKREAKAARAEAKGANDKADQVVASVGQVNGHGTVQDQGAQILAEIAELRRSVHSLATTMDSVVDAAGLVRDRLKQHDREHSHHKQRARELADQMDDLQRRVG